MSDVTVTPAAPSQPATPAPQAQEVPINQNQVSSPNPIGPQAPQAPVGDLKGSEHRPPSRREVIQKAIQEAADRADKTPPKTARSVEKPAPAAAEAKKGHNQPPEDTPDEKLDLKKRPSDLPRGEKGQFAPRAQTAQPDAQNSANERKIAQPAQQPAKQLPPHAPYAMPPQRMAEHAKRDWAAAPESVRGEVWRQQQEFANAYKAYKPALEAFKSIRPFHEMAQKHGTTLEQALTNYVGIENKLREDPLAGLEQIIYNLNLTDPDTNKRIDLRDVAYTVLSQSPEQLKLMKQSNAQTAASQQIGALHQKVDQLVKQTEQMQYDRNHAYTRSAIDQFAETRPRFDELGTTIEQELKLGFNLDTAYRRAELLRPATHAAQTRTPSAQTRPIDRSIHGSPDVAPSNGASRRPQKPSGSAREATLNAIRRMNGSL